MLELSVLAALCCFFFFPFLRGGWGFTLGSSGLYSKPPFAPRSLPSLPYVFIAFSCLAPQMLLSRPWESASLFCSEPQREHFRSFSFLFSVKDFTVGNKVCLVHWAWGLWLKSIASWGLSAAPWRVRTEAHSCSRLSRVLLITANPAKVKIQHWKHSLC